MHFDRLRTWSFLFALVIHFAAPTSSFANENQNASGARAAGSPNQVTEEILQLRQTFGSAWREVGGEATPQTTAAEEQAIRSALLNHVRSNPLPEPIRPPQTSCRRTELRESAQQLDSVAHTLECQELYAEADQLRAVAQRLRAQARQKPPESLRQADPTWKPVAWESAD